MARLSIKRMGNDTPLELTLPERLTIGRNDEGVRNDLDAGEHFIGALAAYVSRRHAEVYRDGDQYFVQDLGSLNCTSVNGERLKPHQPVELNSGDVITLPVEGGKLMDLTYEQ